MAVNKVDYSGETLIDLTEDTVTPDVLLSGETAHSASGEVITGRAVLPACGTCDTAGNVAEKVVMLEGYDNWTLKKGAIIMVKFTNNNTANDVTLNVNGTGGKGIWYSTVHYTSNNTTVCGSKNRYHTYMYDGTYWVWLSYGYDANTTYTNQSLGQGYATCTTAEATTAKVATLSGYSKTLYGIVAVKFTYAVPANATLNINNRGASAIYYRGSAITAGVILAGNTATFMYDGSYYQLLTIDKLTASDVGAVSTVASQGLTATEKNNARNNIEALWNGGGTITGTLEGENFNGDTTWWIDERGYAHLVNLNGSDVPSNPKFTDTTYDTGTSSNQGLTKLYDETGENGDGCYTQKATNGLFQKKEWFLVGRYVAGAPIATLKDYSEAYIVCVPTESNNWGKYNSVLHIPIAVLDSDFVKTNGLTFSGEMNGVPWNGNIKFDTNNNNIYYSEVYFNNGDNIAGTAIMYVYLR